jgi:hypothetical protein
MYHCDTLVKFGVIKLKIKRKEGRAQHGGMYIYTSLLGIYLILKVIISLDSR